MTRQSSTFIALLKRSLIVPFPRLASTSARLKISFVAAIVGLVMLLLFQPFDLDLLGDKTVLVIVGYIVIDFLVLLIVHRLLPLVFSQFFTRERWTRWRQLLEICLVLMGMGVANAIYAVVIELTDWSWFTLWYFQRVTWMGAIIPVFIYLLLNQSLSLQEHLHEIKMINQGLGSVRKTKNELGTILRFISQDNQGDLHIPMKSFLVLKTSRNYVEIFYLEEETLKSKIVRNTMVGLLKAFEGNMDIFQCHRSFVINVNQLKKITRVEGGYQLVIEGLPFLVPVARSKMKALRSLIVE